MRDAVDQKVIVFVLVQQMKLGGVPFPLQQAAGERGIVAVKIRFDAKEANLANSLSIRSGALFTGHGQEFFSGFNLIFISDQADAIPHLKNRH